ncbi:MAG: hypothetical protein V3R33_07875, partial [Anaerolineales bacterium]
MDNHHNEDGLKQPENQPASSFLTGIRDLLGRILEGENRKRIATIGAVILLVTIVVIAMRALYLNSQNSTGKLAVFAEESSADGPDVNQAGDSEGALEMPSFIIDQAGLLEGIQRIALLHTSIPTRSRVDVLVYTV